MIDIALKVLSDSKLVISLLWLLFDMSIMTYTFDRTFYFFSLEIFIIKTQLRRTWWHYLMLWLNPRTLDKIQLMRIINVTKIEFDLIFFFKWSFLKHLLVWILITIWIQTLNWRLMILKHFLICIKLYLSFFQLDNFWIFIFLDMNFLILA